MDFIEGLPKSHGHDVILVVVDRHTKFVHVFSLHHPFTTAQVAALFMQESSSYMACQSQLSVIRGLFLVLPFGESCLSCRA